VHEVEQRKPGFRSGPVWGRGPGFRLHLWRSPWRRPRLTANGDGLPPEPPVRPTFR